MFYCCSCFEFGHKCWKILDLAVALNVKAKQGVEGQVPICLIYRIQIEKNKNIR